ncbi:hypothetical protein [Sinomonas flava]
MSDEDPRRDRRERWRDVFLAVFATVLLIGVGVWLLVFVANTCFGGLG